MQTRMQTFRTQCRIVQTNPHAKLVAAEGTDWAKCIVRPLIGSVHLFRRTDEILGLLNATFRCCPSTGAAASLFRFYRIFLTDKQLSRRVMRLILDYETEFVNIPSVNTGFMERVEAYRWSEAHRSMNFHTLANKVTHRELVALPHVCMCAHSCFLKPVPDSIREIWG